MKEFLKVSKILEIKNLSTGIEMNDQTALNKDNNEHVDNVADEYEKTLNEDGASVEPQTHNSTTTNNAANRRVRRADGIKYDCNQCNKQFSDPSPLSRHTKSKHEGLKYDCNQCDYQATNQSNLMRHMQSIHEGVKYACNQCDYKAPRQFNLKRHVKLKHDGVKQEQHAQSGEVLHSGSPNKTGSEMLIVSTCTIDSSQFELNVSKEQREHQEQDSEPDCAMGNLLALTVKTELTTHKKESSGPEENEINLLTDNTVVDHLNVSGLENTAEVVCPPSALGILLEDLVQRFESKENIPTDELLTIIDKIIQTEVE